jgi:hypothetical protein
MLNAKNPGIIEAEIIMKRQIHKGCFLLVEGPDDSRFWRGRIGEKHCNIVIAEGKSNLVGAIEKLDAKSFSGALGIVDDDCDSLENWRNPSKNLLVTDAHDLECLILRSPTLERGILAELGDPKKIEDFQTETNLTVRERLLENGLPFGRLRWLSKRARQGYKAPKPDGFMNAAQWSVEECKLMAHAAAQLAQNSPEDLRDDLAKLPEADPWRVCQGHDLLDILRLGLSKVLGLKSSCATDHLAGVLRAGFQDADFSQTRLYSNICDWQQANAPYRIFPTPETL